MYSMPLCWKWKWSKYYYKISCKWICSRSNIHCYCFNTANGISKFGFELTAEDEWTEKGTFTITNSVETKLTNNGSAVTHKGTGTSGQSNKTWTFDWMPWFCDINRNVKFWGSFLVANGDFTNSGDIYHFDTTLF